MVRSDLHQGRLLLLFNIFLYTYAYTLTLVTHLCDHKTKKSNRQTSKNRYRERQEMTKRKLVMNFK